MVLITIVTGLYKPINITGGPHIVCSSENQHIPRRCLRNRPPGRQQGVVASCQQGVTLRAHPTSEEELVGIFLLHSLEMADS